jgi:hypothetical protein
MKKLKLAKTKEKKTSKHCFSFIFFLVVLTIGAFILLESHSLSWNHINQISKTILSRKENIDNHETIKEYSAKSLQVVEHPSNGHDLKADLSKRMPRIAYAITINKDGYFQDGAAILAYSIIKISENIPYQVSLIAFVHPNVTKARPFLKNLGFHVIEAPTPIK